MSTGHAVSTVHADSAPAVRLDRVGRAFRQTHALDDVTLEVPHGTVCGLLGRNGAGKTTLMSLLAGHDRPTSGRVEVFGHDPFTHAPTTSAVSFVRDAQRYPDDFRLRHVLAVAPRFHPQWSHERAAELVDAFRLPARTDVKKFSRGQLSALGIVLGLSSRAPLTVFDEPYLGLDASARRIFYAQLVEDLAEHPRTVVVSTHLIDEMEALLEHVVVLEGGRVVRDCSLDEARSAAYTVSGPAVVVADLVHGLPVLASSRLGGLRSVTVEATLTPEAAAAARAAGAQVEPASLQDVVAAHGAGPSTGHTTEQHLETAGARS
ncbi:ABC-2 type transport system ATP-binding protein [Quadrisphaera granulorum]|uniref:ABC-2 type transport system ATP-binding protein n=1 Tax=Quadrisphaera granulorum TaxID=317664 RepID=A0A315ZYF4_9ACTN|nr:ABC transporter ATP-binding protein [Quadrisphaera granulorum]PWJ50272.1 ABC-2 type transport system ATP-binding protein [Quadrisphaera granulorum]SZE98038.1 ABC-2 type transport system ATP-binding protein [Quadrisphaera granulorum]